MFHYFTLNKCATIKLKYWFYTLMNLLFVKNTREHKCNLIWRTMQLKHGAVGVVMDFKMCPTSLKKNKVFLQQILKAAEQVNLPPAVKGLCLFKVMHCTDSKYTRANKVHLKSSTSFQLVDCDPQSAFCFNCEPTLYFSYSSLTVCNIKVRLPLPHSLKSSCANWDVANAWTRNNFLRSRRKPQITQNN